MTEHLVQGSPEWIAARLGSFGSSYLGALMAKGEGKTRAKLIRQIAAERLSGVPQGWEGNASTEDGHRQEPLARRAFEMRTGAFVEPVGLIRHPVHSFIHASPDGLVDDDAGCEFKSHVRLITHLEAIESAQPRAHYDQCQLGMACSGRGLWHYGHYCEAAPERIRLFMFPVVKRDDARIAELVAACIAAEQEVQAIVAKYGAPLRAAA